MTREDIYKLFLRSTSNEDDLAESDQIKKEVFQPDKSTPVTKKTLAKKILHHSRKGIITSFVLLLITLITIPIFTYIYFARDLTSKETIMNRNNKGIILSDRNGTPFFAFYEARSKSFIPLSQIPKVTQQAVIAAEDKGFYSHPGFSIRAIGRSTIENLKQEEFAYGGSTITQQLVKNVLLSPQKNLFRKYQEVVLASEIDRRYTKDEILEMYLNSVYFGEGAFGIDDASNTYFGKSPADLSLSESSLLVGLLTAPSALSPLSNNVDLAKQKQSLVLQKMVEQRFITQNQKASSEYEVLKFNPKKENINNTAPHFALMVKEELNEKYGEEFVTRSGFNVKTTLDLSWQEFAETTVKNQVDKLQRNRTSNGAAVAIDPKTGEIKVLVGSKDWFDENFGKVNMVTSPRQPGSAFKPIVYSTALEKKLITPATVLKDEPVTFPGGYKPKNYDGKFRGDVLVRRALANSLNIPAIEVINKVGVNQTVSYAKTMGITTLNNPEDYGLSLVLGAAEVPLIELTNAYAIFANFGNKTPYTTILEITDKSNKQIYKHSPKSEKVLSSETAFLISSILSDNNARAETFGNSLTISRAAAVKTGTTDDYKDALTVGFTPLLVVGVWVGNNDNTPMDNIAGSLGAAPIWRTLMERFLQKSSKENFEPPFGITTISICKDKGLVYNEATTSAYKEYFIRGTQPTKQCNPSLTPAPSEQPSPTNPPSEPTPTSIPETPTPQPPSPTSIPTPQPTDTIPLPTISI